MSLPPQTSVWKLNNINKGNKTMKKSMKLAIVALAAVMSVPVSAQVVIKGVANNNRYDDGDQLENKSKYVGWLPASQDPEGVGKAIYANKFGVYNMTWDGSSLSTPVQDLNYPISDYYSNGTFTDVEKALLVNSQTNMYGNSGAGYINGTITTVFSRDEQSTVDEELFIARHWEASTGKMYNATVFGKDMCIESAGMAYNPVDEKVYGLFYLTEQKLSEEFTNDPDFFVDQDGESSDVDAGYCICTIDLNTMKITPITNGLYYYNFVTFAINSEGRAFAMTSGGTSSSATDADGRLVDINGNLTGATLCEFDLSTGLMLTNDVAATDPETGETYTEQVNKYTHGCGYASQYRRQAACFAKSNPNKMYWNGYVNSGKGINSYGSWASLPDSEWRTNGKYDTALYEVDIETGTATRLATIKDRLAFSCLWVDGDDCSDGANTGIQTIDNKAQATGNVQVFNTAGQLVYAGTADAMSLQPGLYVVKNGNVTEKKIVK